MMNSHLLFIVFAIDERINMYQILPQLSLFQDEKSWDCWFNHSLFGSHCTFNPSLNFFFLCKVIWDGRVSFIAIFNVQELHEYRDSQSHSLCSIFCLFWLLKRSVIIYCYIWVLIPDESSQTIILSVKSGVSICVALCNFIILS